MIFNVCCLVGLPRLSSSQPELKRLNNEKRSLQTKLNEIGNKKLSALRVLDDDAVKERDRDKRRVEENRQILRVHSEYEADARQRLDAAKRKVKADKNAETRAGLVAAETRLKDAALAVKESKGELTESEKKFTATQAALYSNSNA